MFKILKEKKRNCSFKIPSKIIYLQINLTKEVKELYSENYVTVMTETEDNGNKWKCICAYKPEKLILSNCPCYPKQTIRFNAIPIKIQTQLLTELEQIILKLIWN